MSEAYGPDFITVTDEDGNEFEMELVDTLEHNLPRPVPRFSGG